MSILYQIAMKHILARKRQSMVSLAGIILGVAFFLAISSLMQGSERDFMKRLVDNSPHITISDEFRNPRRQPLQILYPDHLLDIHNVKPLTETRGIRGYEQILGYLKSIDGVRASPVLLGQAVISYTGKNQGITLNGMIPSEVGDVTTIRDYMIVGTMEDLISDPDGIVIGAELARRLSLGRGDHVTVVSPTGGVRVFRIFGIFRTGRGSYDSSQTFVDLKRVQSLFDRANRINSIIVKMPDPNMAQTVARDVEGRFSYKSVSWQEASEDLMNTFAIRNTIMYTVVSAVLVVAAVGIYNVISTVVMEKQKDIAILKSMGFTAPEIQKIFLVQGSILGIVGAGLGLPLGSLLMLLLQQIEIKPPGGTEIVSMPLVWDWPQFAVAAAFAMIAAMLAAFLPARKAARVDPVVILRGGMG